MMQLFPEPETSLDISTIFISLLTGGINALMMRWFVPSIRAMPAPVVAIVGALGGMAGGRLVGPYLADLIGSMVAGLVFGAAIGGVVVTAAIAWLRGRR